jgi:hypothetical protein
MPHTNSENVTSSIPILQLQRRCWWSSTNIRSCPLYHSPSLDLLFIATSSHWRESLSLQLPSYPTLTILPRSWSDHASLRSHSESCQVYEWGTITTLIDPSFKISITQPSTSPPYPPCLSSASTPPCLGIVQPPTTRAFLNMPIPLLRSQRLGTCKLSKIPKRRCMSVYKLGGCD